MKDRRESHRRVQGSFAPTGYVISKLNEVPCDPIGNILLKGIFDPPANRRKDKDFTLGPQECDRRLTLKGIDL